MIMILTTIYFYFRGIFPHFPFPVSPHHLRYSFQNYSDPSRHICHTPSIITCPFSAYPYIIPNRTSVQARPSRPVLCTSLLLSWRVTSHDCPTLSFHLPPQMVTVSLANFFFVLAIIPDPTSFHLLVQPTPQPSASFRSLIVIRLLPHTPRVSLRKFPFFDCITHY